MGRFLPRVPPARRGRSSRGARTPTASIDRRKYRAVGVDPAWLTAVAPLHQNPQYRDPKLSKPNYVYVRVRNRGDAASSGTERLRVYWAKASTGLSWPSQWVDYTNNTGGSFKLYGLEITKPRKNAGCATAHTRQAKARNFWTIFWRLRFS